jgi:phosphoribosylglycinamide formyltransferase-1
MRILSPEFVQRFKILNIHPALLPSFKGTEGIKAAFDYGVKVTGVTVHFVDEEMDHGPIVLQEPVRIKEDDTLESLEARIHKIEHKIYPQAIRLFIENRLKFEGRKVKIL